MIDYTKLDLTIEEEECLQELIEHGIEEILNQENEGLLNIIIQVITENKCDCHIDTLLNWYKEDTSRLEDMLDGIKHGLPDTGAGILIAGQYEYYQRMLHNVVEMIDNARMS